MPMAARATSRAARAARPTRPMTRRVAIAGIRSSSSTWSASSGRVIDAFADGYLDGATPNPCQACNQYIKFDELLRRGLAAYGADVVATGHYARVEDRDGRRCCCVRGCGQGPDLLPVGAGPGAAAPYPLPAGGADQAGGAADRRRAGPAHRRQAGEPGDLLRACGDYRALLEERRGYAGEPGPIVDADGSRVGTRGYAHYTVGQRHGLGVALGEASTSASASCQQHGGHRSS